MFCPPEASEEEWEEGAEDDKCEDAEDEDVEVAQQWTMNWRLMSIFIGVSHGVEDMLLAYSTSVYPEQMGLIGNATLYGVWIFSSMLLGPPVSRWLGARCTMTIGLCMQTAFYAFFIIASVLPKNAVAQWVVAILGFVIGGLAAGFVWSSEGVLLAETCRLVARAEGKPVEQTSARMAAIFGCWNLLLETIVKLVNYGFEAAGLPQAAAFSVAFALAVLAVVCFCLCTKPTYGVRETKQPVCDEVKETLQTAISPTIWLLSFVSLAFTAYAVVIALINGDYVKTSLGSQYVGLMSALVSFTGFAVQFPFSCIGNAFRYGKSFILDVASLVYVAMPVLILTLNLSSFGWALSIFFVAQGVGRGVFRGIYYSLIADHFAGEATEAAFGAVTMINALGSTFAFALAAVLSASKKLEVLAWITLVFGALIAPGYLCVRGLEWTMSKSCKTFGDSSDSEWDTTSETDHADE